MNKRKIEEIEGIVKKQGNGAHIMLPKLWIGEIVTVRIKQK